MKIGEKGEKTKRENKNKIERVTILIGRRGETGEKEKVKGESEKGEGEEKRVKRRKGENKKNKIKRVII